MYMYKCVNIGFKCYAVTLKFKMAALAIYSLGQPRCNCSSRFVRASYLTTLGHISFVALLLR